MASNWYKQQQSKVQNPNLVISNHQQDIPRLFSLVAVCITVESQRLYHICMIGDRVLCQEAFSAMS
jgi:hypothetical protein